MGHCFGAKTEIRNYRGKNNQKSKKTLFLHISLFENLNSSDRFKKFKFEEVRRLRPLSLGYATVSKLVYPHLETALNLCGSHLIAVCAGAAETKQITADFKLYCSHLKSAQYPNTNIPIYGGGLSPISRQIFRFAPVGGGGGNCTPVQKKTQTGHSMLSVACI